MKSLHLSSPCLRPNLFQESCHIISSGIDKLSFSYAIAILVDIPLEEVEREWKSSGWSQQVKEVATHHDVFKHLFGDAYFYPRVPLHICYDYDEEYYTPVHFGNAIKPKEVRIYISYEDWSQSSPVYILSDMSLSSVWRISQLWIMLDIRPKVLVEASAFSTSRSTEGNFSRENVEMLFFISLKFTLSCLFS